MTNGAKPRPEATAIDLGELDLRLGYLLRRAQIAVFQEFFAVFEGFDIRPAQYSILTVVEHNEGLSQTQVADALGIKKTNLVAMIGVLDDRGLVRREPTPTDRRANALYLTAAGRALLRRLHKAGAELEERLIARIGAEEYRRLQAPLRALAAGRTLATFADGHE